jgi:hypothetical protein
MMRNASVIHQGMPKGGAVANFMLAISFVLYTAKGFLELLNQSLQRAFRTMCIEFQWLLARPDNWWERTTTVLFDSLTFVYIYSKKMCPRIE